MTGERNMSETTTYVRLYDSSIYESYNLLTTVRSCWHDYSWLTYGIRAPYAASFAPIIMKVKNAAIVRHIFILG